MYSFNNNRLTFVQSKNADLLQGNSMTTSCYAATAVVHAYALSESFTYAVVPQRCSDLQAAWRDMLCH